MIQLVLVGILTLLAVGGVISARLLHTLTTFRTALEEQHLDLLRFSSEHREDTKRLLAARLTLPDQPPDDPVDRIQGILDQAQADHGTLVDDLRDTVAHDQRRRDDEIAMVREALAALHDQLDAAVTEITQRFTGNMPLPTVQAHLPAGLVAAAAKRGVEPQELLQLMEAAFTEMVVNAEIKATL